MDRRKIVRHNSKSLISTNLGENEETTIPVDLLIELLSRLPAKTIARCRCVSKQWNSLLGDKYFTESFLTSSSTRPRLLFAFRFAGKWHFFSSPQPQNLGEVTADYHMSFSGDWYNKACFYSYGFIYMNDTQLLNGKLERILRICNPSTGQQLTLPKVRARNLDVRSFFGYDPIQKRLKVLCMTVTTYRHLTRSREHQVLTLGDGKLSWRKIECSFKHYPQPHSNVICIKGVMYYIARSNTSTLIACFDVSSEKFSFIEVDQSQPALNLIKYKGKLGVVMHAYGSYGHELWVLDDTEKDKWWKNVLPNTALEGMRSVWATDTGEIFWVPNDWKFTYYVHYYNVETKKSGRVKITGIEEKLLAVDPYLIKAHFTFADHVENVMFL